MIPTRNKLPEDAAEWTSVEVSLPRLTRDSAESCPEAMEEILRYVRAESAGTDQADQDRLTFLRTAQIEHDQFWLWGYEESDGTQCFVFFRVQEDGSTDLCLTETNGLSPEQYLLAAYYDEIYWS